MYKCCRLCPRDCKVNRDSGEIGYCRAPAQAVVAKTMIHKWEEPALAGAGGSGAIFFSGCTLGCIYCQNRKISAAPEGVTMSSGQLRKAMDALIAEGAENIDLVTPGHYLPSIIPALSPKLPVPVVYNCGGYERVEMIKELDGLVDIYLPDFKYADSRLSSKLSGAPDYFECATEAIQEMVRQTGAPQWKGERLVRGTVIRHLILPGCVENSLRILDWIGDHFTPGEVLVSLMRQYTPMDATAGMPPFDRRITEEEYDAVLSWMYLNHLEGFVQEQESAHKKYIPDFTR